MDDIKHLIGPDCIDIIMEFINFTEESLKLQNLPNNCGVHMNLTNYIANNKCNLTAYILGIGPIKGRIRSCEYMLSRDIYIKRVKKRYFMRCTPCTLIPSHTLKFICNKDKYSTVFEFKSIRQPGEMRYKLII